MVVRGQFTDFFLETMKPALEAVIWNKYNRFPTQWSKIFRQDTTVNSIYQTSQLTGVGLMTEIAEGAPVRFDQPVQGYDKTFKPRRWGLGIQVSQDVVEDDTKLKLVAKQGRMLANSAAETQEVSMASILNNGFTTGTGPDGVVLFSASHPLAKAGGVENNLLSAAADLDVTSLELALTDYRTMVNAEGAHVHLPKPRVVVAPANQWNVIEILASNLRSDTDHNAINAFQHGLDGTPDWMVYDYLTDDDGWFLLAPPEDTDLLVVWRRKPYTKYWVDDDTEAGRVALRYKLDYGWADWYGTYGTPGA